MSKITVISHEEMDSLLKMQQSKDIEDIKLCQGIINGYCEKSDNGEFHITYNNTTRTLNIKVIEKKFWFNYLYSEICRMWKDKPTKNKVFIANG